MGDSLRCEGLFCGYVVIMYIKNYKADLDGPCGGHGYDELKDREECGVVQVAKGTRAKGKT